MLMGLYTLRSEALSGGGGRNERKGTLRIVAQDEWGRPIAEGVDPRNGIILSAGSREEKVLNCAEILKKSKTDPARGEENEGRVLLFPRGGET